MRFPWPKLQLFIVIWHLIVQLVLHCMFIAIKFLFSIVCKPFGVCHLRCVCSNNANDWVFFFAPMLLQKDWLKNGLLCCRDKETYSDEALNFSGWLMWNKWLMVNPAGVMFCLFYQMNLKIPNRNWCVLLKLDWWIRWYWFCPCVLEPPNFVCRKTIVALFRNLVIHSIAPYCRSMRLMRKLLPFIVSMITTAKFDEYFMLLLMELELLMFWHLYVNTAVLR